VNEFEDAPASRKQTREPSSRSAAYRAAIRLLEHRDRTESDLSGRLTTKGFDADCVAETMQRLKREGFVDDARFAERFASSMREIRGYGTHRIRLELQKRGLDRSLIDSVTSGEAAAGEADLVLELAHKKAARLPVDMPRDQALRRLAGYLGRKGFSSDQVWSAAKQALERTR
jgi:regulatory protein